MMRIESKSLGFDAFTKYYSSLRERKDVKALYSTLASEDGINYETFRRFCLEIQKVLRVQSLYTQRLYLERLDGSASSRLLQEIQPR